VNSTQWSFHLAELQSEALIKPPEHQAEFKQAQWSCSSKEEELFLSLPSFPYIYQQSVVLGDAMESRIERGKIK
jgi:hypothetical protein